MIEAVNSVISNAQALKISSAQVDSARTTQVVTESVSEAPQAPYISPFIAVPDGQSKAVIQIRDSDTGDVLKQYPSEARLEQIRREEVARQKSLQSEDVNKPSQDPVGESARAQVSIQEQSSYSSETSGPSQALIASAALASAAQTGFSGTSSVSVSA